MIVKMQESEIQQVVNYLMERPFKEVYQLIYLLDSKVKEAQIGGQNESGSESGDSTIKE